MSTLENDDTSNDEPTAFDRNAPFKLSAPLTTHRGDVTFLTLKSPKARSYIKHGDPFKYDENKIMVINVPVMIKFVADMCGVDAVLLEQMEACDVMPICHHAAAFLLFPNPISG